MDFKRAGLLSITVNQIFKSYFKNDAIVSFNYPRIFEDGSRAELWSNGMAMEHTYLQSGLTIKTHAPKLYESDEKFIFLLDRIQSFSDKTKDNYVKHLSEVRELFGYDNTLLVKGNDPICFEIFCFYGGRSTVDVKSYVINNFTKLEWFMAEFKKNHQNLIKQAEENRIVGPWIRQNNLQIGLTSKERLVAQYYSRGMSAKNIGIEIGCKRKNYI